MVFDLELNLPASKEDKYKCGWQERIWKEPLFKREWVNTKKRG